MRKRFNEIRNSKLMAVDGVIGKVVDLLIQDDTWTVRYLVVNVQNTIPSRHVLISTSAILGCDFSKRIFSTTLDSQQVINSPRLDDNQPISRQYEEALVEHYGWPIYWLGRAVQLSPQTLEEFADADATQFVDENGSANLRSANEICGYQIIANDGEAGYMKDLVVTIDSWMVDFATAEATSWIPSESSMFSTKHIQSVNWSDRKITVDLRQQVLEPISSSKPETSIVGEPWSAQPYRPAT
ncbi:MAG: PRC-barrel domain-containing protein [Planctomycetota bacterium]